MTTTENNILISLFMGMKPHDINELDGFWTNTIKAHKFDNVMSLQFHSDWNWLMEVVEKIESLEYYSISIQIWNKRCSVDVSENFEKDLFHYAKSEKTKIEAVYNACIEFIKWYNQKK